MTQILTEREKSVLFLLAQGLKNEEISKMLHISVHTTKAHLEMIYEKLGVKNRVQAAIKAIVIGVVDIKELV
ncbi:MAG: helix-turn-helix transcriptional regulator [Candidatus Gastranaerophilales bacterium]|nr:helix-turn-helix transcriptional regulator [Candidatus Gastranaerophilales bacterium]